MQVKPGWPLQPSLSTRVTLTNGIQKRRLNAQSAPRNRLAALHMQVLFCAPVRKAQNQHPHHSNPVLFVVSLAGQHRCQPTLLPQSRVRSIQSCRIEAVQLAHLAAAAANAAKRAPEHRTGHTGTQTSSVSAGKSSHVTYNAHSSTCSTPICSQCTVSVSATCVAAGGTAHDSLTHALSPGLTRITRYYSVNAEGCAMDARHHKTLRIIRTVSSQLLVCL